MGREHRTANRRDRRKTGPDESAVLEILRAHGAAEIDARIAAEMASETSDIQNGDHMVKRFRLGGAITHLPVLARAALLVFALGVVSFGSGGLLRGAQTRRMISRETELLVAGVLLPVDQQSLAPIGGYEREMELLLDQVMPVSGSDSGIGDVFGPSGF
jgi:hypothetical protein